MAQSYPIVAHRTLDPVQRRLLFKRSREAGEMPRASAHEVLVYRVGGQFVVDKDVRRLSDDQVVQATHVSVVDVSVDVPVLVELTLPAAEAGDFTLHATFACTVTDPAIVVGNGRQDTATFLATYLRGVPQIFEIGQRYRIDEVAEMRRELSAWVTSCVVTDPPIESGMRIRLASAHVLDPQQYRDYQDRRREELFAHSLTRLKDDHIAELDESHQTTRHRSGLREQGYDHEIAARAAQHDSILRKHRVAEHLSITQQTFDAIGSNPELASLYAQTVGEESSTQYASYLRERARQDAEYRSVERIEAVRRQTELLRHFLDNNGADFIDPAKLELLAGNMIDDYTRTLGRAGADDHRESLESGHRPVRKADSDAD
ncbi:hypothetical protein NONO_c75820 [Nocardia nova SH22a]|uniref:Uncharacterized protein n=1 Tax=Nocardia nova SH22a TaxID=1415166 RepID=W5TSP3_9NOCA|nr:hypothetical protein [Nocardia nova]AHH22337.1 hypothetical protein NONO_c75820 [Nocardia nova SH22a]